MRKILRWFETAKDKRTIDAISIENITTLNRFTLFIFSIELLTLVTYIWGNWQTERFWNTIINVSVCIVTCAIVAIWTNKICVKYQETREISKTLSNGLVVVFYLVLSLWSIWVDGVHYKFGEQMLTFYIVQFVFFCFLVIVPKMGAVLVGVIFALFYFVLYQVDGAVNVQPQNLVIFAVAVVVGNAMQYDKLKTSQLDKQEILDLNELFQNEAKLDDLTGLKNRYALRTDVEKYRDKEIVITMVDVDFFKEYNDTYGHVIGDEVLKRVAAAIRTAFGGNSVYRYGGDEFLIIFQNYDESVYESKMAAWKEEVSQISITGVEREIKCSSGCARGSYQDDEGYVALVEKADEQLYEVKRKRPKQ